MLPLHRMILETIAYYDVFNYPLSEFEIWKLLLSSDGDGEAVGDISLRNIREVLEGSFLQKRISRSRGFVCLCGREYLVERRVRLGKRADRNIARASRIARLMRFFPFIRMVGITGSLSMKNAGGKSDWDFLIVLASGHIWTGRALSTAALHLLGMRRHGKYVSRRACLNSWITTSSLEIRLKDIFSSSEYLFMIPIFGFDVFREFQRKNMWIRRFRPNFEVSQLPNRYCIQDTVFSRIIRDVLEWMFSSRSLERLLGSIQRKKIAANPKTKSPEGFIEASDDRLIFLPKPRGPRIFEEFCRRVSDIETAVL